MARALILLVAAAALVAVSLRDQPSCSDPHQLNYSIGTVIKLAGC